MEKTITVKGTGSISEKSDLILITITILTHRQDYRRTIEQAAAELEEIQAAVTACGLKKELLKTENYNISTQQKQIQNKQGMYQWVEDGYLCSHNLSVEIDFDTELLGELLQSLSNCSAKPHLNITFSIKDKENAKLKLLENAVVNAKVKAEILTKSAQVNLGEIVHIDYSWGELYLNSPTSYKIEEDLRSLGAVPAMNITPQDIKATEHVSITWKIL